MARSHMTPEQAREHADAKRAKVQALLAEAMEQLTDPDAWEVFLERGSSLSRYSFRNQMLIGMQCPEASDVAGYVEWQARGRQVRRGETGLLIFAPVTRKAPVDEHGQALKRAPEPGEDTVARMCGVKVTSVFDISQTDPIEGKPFKPAASPAARTLAEIRGVVVDIGGDSAQAVIDAMDAATGLVRA
jgi:hypothetical protein